MKRFIIEFYHLFIKKHNTNKLYKIYNESQYWDKDQLKQFQVERFKKLWAHAIENVPYYQELSEKIGLDKDGINSQKDIERIPILTKDIVRREFDRLKATNLGENRFLKESTSGSTGSNFHFFYDTAIRPNINALEMRKYNMMDCSIYDKELIIWGSTFEFEKRINPKLDLIKDWIKNRKILSGYNLSDEGIRNIFDQMIRFQPSVIKSYPSILMTISAYFKKHSLKYQPKTIHIGGEKLYDFQKREIENTFDCPVYDFYGARDMRQIAMNCSERKGLHVFMENVIFEVINGDKMPIDEGEGDIILTDLHNYAMPFIRYKIGDRAKISKDKNCICGRGLQLVDEILGRSFEIIEFPNGNKVGGTFWTFVMKSVPGIKDFQVIQEDIFTITVNYTIDSSWPGIDTQKIIKHIHLHSGDNLKIIFHETDKIPVTQAGKMQFVISKI